MDQLTVYGEVIATRGSDLGVRVENEQDLRAYWQAHEVDTDADWFGPGAPVLSINRRRDVAACKIGDRVSLTVETTRRSNGKVGIDTMGFQVLATVP